MNVEAAVMARQSVRDFLPKPVAADDVWGKADLPDSLGAALQLPDELMLFARMSLGDTDLASPINLYRTGRAATETFSTMLGFG